MTAPADPTSQTDADDGVETASLDAEHGLSLLVHRGPEASLRTIWDLGRHVLGGHLRPDATVAAVRSAPIRVQAGAGLDGTVRVIQILVPSDRPVLTDLSMLVLPGRMGFGDAAADGWAAFGELPLEAMARALSDETGPVACLSQRDGESPLGSYSLFGSGRRLWASCYRPGDSYSTWDGSEFLSEPLEVGDPAPPEGDYDEFAAHGLQLLFPTALGLPPEQRLSLLPSLRQACRAGQRGAEAWMLVEDGRFVPPGQEATEDELAELTGSLWGGPDPQD